jgi:sigma-E factor negative regulatory protein RseC
MIETQVRVLKAGDGLAWVESTEQNGCGACQASSSCAVSGLGRFFSHRRQPIAVAAQAAQAGQLHRLAVEEADFLKASLLAYLLPALLAVLGAVLAASAGDVAAALGMALGFGLGLLLARLLARRVASPLSLSSHQGETP